MKNNLSRRNFLSQGCGGLSAVWISAHFPALLSAARHARESVQSAAPKLTFFTPEQAIEIDAITSRIIPSDDTPGAHEAGVAYFIDQALTTFAVDDQKNYREGLAEFAVRTKELFPSIDNFSSATPEQQDEILSSFDEKLPAQRRPNRPRSGGQNFFETLRSHTIIAFLLDPDSGGDPNGTGWKVLGRERSHMFQPPFGYYDQHYAGWQPFAAKTDKAKL
jgi:gluconate 2-dehydrogenase gamma chain